MSTNFKLRLLLLVCFAAIGFSASAQSTVYVFIKSSGNSEVTVKLNGEAITDLNGPVKKTIKPMPPMQIPMVMHEACYRKITLNDEGKVLLSVDLLFTAATTLAQTLMTGEAQLNLVPGSVHYVFATNKGLNDLQLKQLDEKEATKLFKKYVELPELQR